MRWGTICRTGLEVLLPSGPCALCGGDSAGGPAPGVCRSCWRSRRRPVEPLCARCGAPFPVGGSAAGGDVCGTCLEDPPAYEAHRSAYLYEGPARSLLLLYKEAHRYPLAGLLGGAVARCARRSWPGEEFDAVVPVPGRLGARMRRGFEPAHLMAGAVAGRLGTPRLRALRLRRAPRPQKGLTAAQRRENLRGAFGLALRVAEGSKVLLLDDVFTTGATLGEAARTLARAGAVVYCATWAFTPERALDMVRSAPPQPPEG